MDKNECDRDPRTSEGTIIIHLRCNEVNPEDLSPLPHLRPQVYISDVSDDDTSWVKQIVKVLRPDLISVHSEFEAFEGLYFPLSKLTTVGVEAIAKGLFEAGIDLENFKVSSCNINASNGTDKFKGMITKKYFSQGCTIVNITGDEKEMDFTDFVEFVPNDLTMSLMNKLANMKAASDSDDDTEKYKAMSALCRRQFGMELYTDKFLLDDFWF